MLTSSFLCRDSSQTGFFEFSANVINSDVIVLLILSVMELP